jgi:hypothetical protein
MLLDGSSEANLMMGNFYLLCDRRKWAAVCISKNACTSLKRAVLENAGIAVPTKEDIHDSIGYTSGSSFLRPVASGKPDGFTSFAVWRDPVERFLSAYVHFAIDRAQHRSLPDFLAYSELDVWIDHAEATLDLDPLDQDEHLRRQSDYFGTGDVDWIVPMRLLGRWFEDQGWGVLSKVNASSCIYPATRGQVARLRGLYAPDYALMPFDGPEIYAPAARTG